MKLNLKYLKELIMSKPEKEQLPSIDDAINHCKKIIQDYKWRSTALLFAIVTLFIVFMIVMKYQIEHPELVNNILVENKDGLIKQLKMLETVDASNLPKFNPLSSITIASTQPPDKLIMYSFYLLCVIIISIFTSFYKLCLNEIAKNEHMLIGFLRIRIAGNNCDSGYNTEVRTALTDNAFQFFTKEVKGRIENPIPGHPGTELVSKVLNKILDSVEIKPKTED